MSGERGFTDKLKGMMHHDDKPKNDKDGSSSSDGEGGHSKMKIAAGVLAAGAAAYGAKKLYDHHKEEKEEDAPAGVEGKKKDDDDDDEGGQSKLKMAAGIGAGVLAAGGVAYGAKKLYESHEEKKQQEEVAAGGYGTLGASGDNDVQESEKKDDDDDEEGEGKHSKLKMAAGIGAGILAAGGVAYGAKKLYESHEEKKQQEAAALLQTQSSVTTTTVTSGSYVTASVQGGTGAGVAYGSSLALKHNMSGRFLDQSQYSPMSQKSNQNLAVLGEWNISQSTTWVVEGGSGTVQYGGAIKLRHATTGRYLHSHSGVCAPVTTQNQEVTAYGDGNDDNNVWIVEPWGDEGTSGNWAWLAGVKLRHKTTGVRLFSREVQVSGGGVEVSGFNGDFDENLRWRAHQA